MTYCDYSIYSEGARSYLITLPCFYGDEDFYIAAQMNRFYTQMLGELYDFATSIMNNDVRRAVYRCNYSVEEKADTLIVTVNLAYRESGTKVTKKTISHSWNKGHIVRRSVN